MTFRKVKRRTIYAIGLLLGFVLTFIYTEGPSNALKAFTGTPRANADAPQDGPDGGPGPGPDGSPGPDGPGPGGPGCGGCGDGGSL